jgi:hypothetical protein
MTWSVSHSESERFAAAAQLALNKGDPIAAKELFSKAAEAEARALAALGSDKPRTYGVTAVSAAALWYKAGELTEAERIARKAIEAHNLPEFAVDQLQELLSSIQNRLTEERSASRTRSALAKFRKWFFGPVSERLSTSPVPEPQPAAIEPIWEMGRLTIPKQSATLDLDASNFTFALSALRDEFHDLAHEISRSNVDRRAAIFLIEIAERIPDTMPAQKELFRLGHAEQVLNNFTPVVEREWPEFLVSRYHALLLTHDHVLRQSPIWRQFRRNALRQTLSIDQIANAHILAIQVAKVLREREAEDFVDSALPESLEQLANEGLHPYLASLRLSKDVSETNKELLAIDLIESVNNTLKLIAQAAIKNLRSVNTRVTYRWISRLAIAGAGSAAVANSETFTTLWALISKYPQAFQWLERILHSLR